MGQQNLQRIKRQKTSSQKSGQTYSTVSDKIFLVQHQNSLPAEKRGPELEFFFHELKDNEPRSKQVFDTICAVLGLILLVILYPVIALGIKLSSRGPVIEQIETEGQSGKIFTRYEFKTVHTKSDTAVVNITDQNFFGFGKLLYTSGLYKLPYVINILHHDMSFVGPMAFSKKESRYWNNIFDDFYKRHAVKPGIIPIFHPERKQRSATDIHNQLNQEFRYIVAPTLKKDIKVIFSSF